ncbi:uncharacterized protein LOC105925785 [Fundulus heteroclitus]|uniref:uncharacterized protein LOC105925785 n=1 Tax=Fundulus heteroclitus TaxID=8078 RepID=UPI00165B8FDE|nr:uncharacterized protein LOC105925785 [Fundulus heteroclitus]
MFAAETKALVKCLGSGKNLIYNKDLNQQINLLTVVRIRSGQFWEFPKYKVMNCTLPDLIGKKYSPDAEEKVLVEDFKTSLKTDRSGKLEGGLEGSGTAKLSGSSDCVDGLVQPVSIKIKKANLTALRKEFSGRNIDKGMRKLLKLKKKDKLAFVHETAYNTGPVTMFRKGSQKGSISGSLQKMATMCVSVDIQQDTTFTVKENSTFAYSLVEILLEGDTMEISLENWTHKRKGLTSDALDSDTMEQVQEKIEMMDSLMTPLEQLPESTRGDLLTRLREVLKEEDALSELEEMMDQSGDQPCEHPQSQAARSFMDLLDKSQESSGVKDAAFLLVSAMNVLPEEMLRPLTSCSPETLTVLSQLVESLKDGDEVRLPASVPVPLQQDGELRWAADLLCSSEETLTELSDSWNRPPEVLLEVLALTVRGVHMLQAGC